MALALAACNKDANGEKATDYSKKASWYKLPEAAKDVETNNK